MHAWRIYPHSAAHAKAPTFDPLDGAGGREVANRWTNPGHAVVYATVNPSLAALETLANLATPTGFGERTLLQIELADDIEEVSLELTLRLREDGHQDDPEERTREYGTTWLRENRSLALLVPSFIMPYDHNVLINPQHPKATSLKVTKQERIRLDERLARLRR